MRVREFEDWRGKDISFEKEISLPLLELTNRCMIVKDGKNCLIKSGDKFSLSSILSTDWVPLFRCRYEDGFSLTGDDKTMFSALSTKNRNLIWFVDNIPLREQARILHSENSYISEDEYMGLLLSKSGSIMKARNTAAYKKLNHVPARL